MGILCVFVSTIQHNLIFFIIILRFWKVYDDVFHIANA